jgi:hypothetical protein
MNQYVKVGEKSKKRHGKWKEEYPTNEGTLVAVGKYKSEKVGVWKTYFDNKLYQKNIFGKILRKSKDISQREPLWKKALHMKFPRTNAIGFIPETGNIMMIKRI